MRLSASRSILAGAIAVFAAVGLYGCGLEAPQANKPISKEDAEMRNKVPLTRSVSLDRAGEIVNVEFELPAPGPNASSALMLGLRIARSNAESGTALSFKLVDAEMAAKVRLVRTDEGSATVVPLMRTLPDLSDLVPVPVDGSVPGLIMTSVDTSLLADAGLLDPALYYDVMKFATAFNVQPGHYRLTIDLAGDHPEFQGEKAEVLVAYSKKPK